jgi:hypothetical protein
MKRIVLVVACALVGAVPASAQTMVLPPGSLMQPVVFPASAVNGGGVVMSPQLLLPDGTVSLPGAAFALDPDTGIRRSGANTMCFTTGGGDLFCGAANITLQSGVNLLFASGTITQYKGITTAGAGVNFVAAQARTGTVTNTGTASIASVTAPATDTVYRVSCDVSITVSTTHSFSCDVTYTDVTNAARTQIIPMTRAGGTGTFLTDGLMTAALTAGAYSSSVLQITVKASTAVTVRTSSGGTFTTVTYTAGGVITQVG